MYGFRFLFSSDVRIFLDVKGCTPNPGVVQALCVTPAVGICDLLVDFERSSILAI